MKRKMGKKGELLVFFLFQDRSLHGTIYRVERPSWYLNSSVAADVVLAFQVEMGGEGCNFYRVLGVHRAEV